jgi:hypothetical protein
MGASAISTMRKPARTVMARAPIATQYDGVRSAGRSSESIVRAATSVPAAAYRKTPTDQQDTAAVASASRQEPVTGSSTAAETATDWLATTLRNQVPSAVARTGRWVRPSTAVQGTT